MLRGRHLGGDRSASTGRRLDRSVPPTSPSRSRMPTRPSPSPVRLSGSNPPVVLDDHDDAAVLPRVGRSRSALRVLGDVRQRLLDDPVERRLHLRGQPIAADVGLDVDLQAALARTSEPAARSLRRGRDRRARTAGARRRVGARPEASRRRAPALRRRRPAPRRRRCPRAASGPAGSTSAPGPSRRAARARAASLELLRLDDASHRIAGHALRQVDRDRARAARASASRRSSSSKRASGPDVVVRDDDPDRRPLRDERHVQARVDAEAAHSRGRPRGPRGRRRPARCAPRSTTPPIFEWPRSSRMPESLVGALAVGGRDDQPVARPRQGDQDDAGLDQLPQPAGDEVEQRRQLELERRARSRSRSTTGTAAASESATRRAARSRSRRPPAPRAASSARRPRR